MSTALKMDISAEMIIKAVKRMKRAERQGFVEDLIAATLPEYLQSIRELVGASGLDE